MSNNQRQCDGKTFFGFTTEKCDAPATVHRYCDEHEQYDFCSRHNFFFDHGHYAYDDQAKALCEKCNPKPWKGNRS